MTLPFRILNWLFSVLSAILEIVALYFLIELLYSHCLRGGEYGISVWLYVYFLPAITAHTVVLALFRICFRTVGLDPIAVAFNLASGVVCIILSLVLLISMVWHCGNEFAYMFYVSGICGLLSGISHLANAIICLIYMPSKEAHYLKPRRKS